MRRVTIVSLIAAVAAPAFVMPAGAAPDTPSVVLVVTQPSGSTVPNAAVAVYLMPFDPPDAYTPERVAFGRADGAGRFTFSLHDHAAVKRQAEKTVSGEVNLLIRAINPHRTRSANRLTVLPVAGRTRMTLHLNSAMEPVSAEEVSTSRLLSSGQVIADTPPPGFSCESVTQDPQPIPGPQDGSPPWDAHAACQEERQESGSSSGFVVRHAKFMNLHLSKGMTGAVTWEKGRGSKTQEAFRMCYPLSGGCSVFSAGAMQMEERSRSNSITIDRTGRDHRTWRFEYKMKRYRQCVEWEWQDAANWGRCKKMKRYFVPHEWTWGSDSKPYRGEQPRMRRGNRIRLPNGVTIRTQSHENKVFGRGMSLFGLSIDSQSNYSEITMLSWTGIPGCRDRFLYGRRHLPKAAREIFATSRGCG